MKPRVEIFSQGEEVVNGQITDTNAAWLAQRLHDMGFRISRHTAVGDRLEDLTGLLREIAGRAECCICTGGLGPTVDDLTAEAVSKAFNCPLENDEIALHQIEQYFVRRNRVMADANRKQALLPSGALRLDNYWGTAPGFAIKHRHCWFYFVPGVPYEMRHLFDERIAAHLNEQFNLQAGYLITLRVFGIGESDLQQKLSDFPVSDRVGLGFRTTQDEIQIKLSFSAKSTQTDREFWVNRARSVIGDCVFAIDGLTERQGGLVDIIANLMDQQHYSLSIVENASNGLLAAKCGNQEWLQTASYSRDLTALLQNFDCQYTPENLSTTAICCAEVLREQEQTDLALVQIGERVIKSEIDITDQSVTLYNALATPKGVRFSTQMVTGPFRRRQNQAALYGLDLIRRYLQDLCL